MRMTPKLLIWMPVVALIAACAVDSMPEPAEGAVLFSENCSVCHGPTARGGFAPGGKRAPDLTRIATRNGGEFPRARVMSQIDGYGRGSVSASIMPEFGALLSGELVPVEVQGTLTPTPRSLAALLFYLESIQGQ